MNHLEFKSPDDGSLLIFDVISRYKEETVFNVAVKTPWFTGVAPSSTYMVSSPADLFREMVNDWMGWKQKKTWSDLEERVSFEATSDATGHISLRIILNGDNYDSCLKVCVMYEAGQLAAMANELTIFFG
ncbi:DUF6228 family protein [Collimonas sp. H4R21]|uniref:DUF6228 family protein n=1 Tax=Collimonas rhizosphaerae TaxID=3126357 RepID=A0ABU9Q171_9BURK